MQIWNTIISIKFSNEECTNSWRETFTKDFEGIYKMVGGTPFTLPPVQSLKCSLEFLFLMHQESARKQIEYYCSEMEALENSLPWVAAIIEKCALEAVPALCQVWL